MKLSLAIKHLQEFHEIFVTKKTTFEKELLALGDAENDVGMLEMAAIGVAVGNASCPARKAADYIMKETNNEGAAGIAMDVFVFDR